MQPGCYHFCSLRAPALPLPLIRLGLQTQWADAGYPEIYRSLPLEELGGAFSANSATVLHLADPQSVLKPDGLRSYLLEHGVRTLLTIPLISRGGISMQLGAAKEVFKAGSGSVLSYLERALDLPQFGLSEARRSAFSLQPTIIEESGLADCLSAAAFKIERSRVERDQLHFGEQIPSALKECLLDEVFVAANFSQCRSPERMSRSKCPLATKRSNLFRKI